MATIAGTNAQNVPIIFLSLNECHPELVSGSII